MKYQLWTRVRDTDGRSGTVVDYIEYSRLYLVKWDDGETTEHEVNELTEE